MTPGSCSNCNSIEYELQLLKRQVLKLQGEKDDLKKLNAKYVDELSKLKRLQNRSEKDSESKLNEQRQELQKCFERIDTYVGGFKSELRWSRSASTKSRIVVYSAGLLHH